MKSYESFEAAGLHGTHRDNRNANGLMHYESGHTPFSLIPFMRRFFLGLRKLYVAIVYKIYYYRAEVSQFFRQTWVRLSMLGLVIFIIFGKDLRLTLNLPAILSIQAADSGSGGSGQEALSLAQPVAQVQEEVIDFQPASLEDLQERAAQTYIQRFAKVSKLEMERFGIPASILMAQALSESWAGMHQVALKHQNHFSQQLQGQQFENAWESWRAHSLLIAQNYPELLQYGQDTDRWAKGLRRSGYSREWRYARKLTRIIEQYDLKRLDR